jgi:predicted GNAT family acetyltransferase
MPEFPVFDVIHDTESSRYEARVRDGQPEAGRVIGILRYQRLDGLVVMPSTITDPAFRGHGIASSLTRRALDDVRDDGLRVRPDCWYVAEWIDQNPAYAELRT